jgi:hypothetical protein
MELDVVKIRDVKWAAKTALTLAGPLGSDDLKELWVILQNISDGCTLREQLLNPIKEDSVDVKDQVVNSLLELTSIEDISEEASDLKDYITNVLIESAFFEIEDYYGIQLKQEKS